MKRSCLLIIILAMCCIGQSQVSPPSCGQKEITEKLYRTHPYLRNFQQQIEKQLRLAPPRTTQGSEGNAPAEIITLPVVVHIIHNNGTENISDAQVLSAIQHLNEAYANTGYYDPSDGVNTQIQFCLAQRDPTNNPTNGINRIQSSLTVMDGFNNSAEDRAVKNLNRWDPRCYINIWLVKQITGALAGYAYLPSAHGMDIDGIVAEAAYFGSSNANDVLIVHEMGHYLGLYHTFQGGCSNTDCSKDGDQVCDTPPDQSTGGIPCNGSANSCSTDALSGFSTDVDDLHKDYLDYGNWNCMKVFTQGQADRMNWMIRNVRKSLLACKSCQPPCPAPVFASFATSANNINAGTLVNFSNTSSNAASFRWYINNVAQGSTTNLSYTFNTPGTYIVKLTGLTTNSLCDSMNVYDTVVVSCPVTASFTSSSANILTNGNITFTNTSTAATSYNWYLNNLPISTTINHTQIFNSPGSYIIKLVSTNGFCADSISISVSVRDSCSDAINFQKTYKKVLGNSFGQHIIKTKDGGSLIAGYQNAGGPNTNDAALIKTDSLGNIQWSKGYVSGEPDIFNHVIQTSEGGYLAIGETTESAATKKKVAIVKTSSIGDISWTIRLSVGSPNGETGRTIHQLSDGTYLFSAISNEGVNAELIIGRVSAIGGIMWYKIFNHVGATDVSSALIDGDSAVFVGSLNTAGIRSAFMMKIISTDGAVGWTKTYTGNVAGESFDQIQRSGNEYLLSGNVATRQIFAITDLAGNFKQSFQLQPFGITEITARAFYDPFTGRWTAVQSEWNGSSIKMQQISRSGILRWSKVYNQSDRITISSANSADGQSAWISGTIGTTNNQNIFAARLDSNGCNGQPDRLQLMNPVLVQNTFNWITIQTALNIPPAPPGFLAYDLQFSTNSYCENNRCTPPTTDTCGRNTFIRKIGGPGEENAYDLKVLPGNEYLVAGGTKPSLVATISEDAILLKLDAKGNFIWQKKLAGGRQDLFTKIVVNSAGDYFVFGTTSSQHNSNGSMLMMKINPAGTVLWSKEYNFFNATYTGFFGVTGAVELPNGDIAFCANSSGINTEVGTLPATFNIIGVIGDNGTIRWVKRFREYYIESGGSVTSLISMNDALFVCASFGVIKLSTANGSLMNFQKKYQDLGSFNSIEVYGSQFRILSNTHDIIFDQQLNLVSAFRVAQPVTDYNVSVGGHSVENGATIQGLYYDTRNTNTVQSLFLSYSPVAGSYEWANKYSFPATISRSLNIGRRTANKGFVFA
ncbi:MAG: hypothetical protein H7Y31_03880, partial [Chitinophagaceae bacterium]|nr:hypothetical protein [Chitinophagaceae bacterium]